MAFTLAILPSHVLYGIVELLNPVHIRNLWRVGNKRLEKMLVDQPVVRSLHLPRLLTYPYYDTSLQIFCQFASHFRHLQSLSIESQGASLQSIKLSDLPPSLTSLWVEFDSSFLLLVQESNESLLGEGFDAAQSFVTRRGQFLISHGLNAQQQARLTEKLVSPSLDPTSFFFDVGQVLPHLQSLTIMDTRTYPSTLGIPYGVNAVASSQTPVWLNHLLHSLPPYLHTLEFNWMPLLDDTYVPLSVTALTVRDMAVFGENPLSKSWQLFARLENFRVLEDTSIIRLRDRSLPSGPTNMESAKLLASRMPNLHTLRIYSNTTTMWPLGAPVLEPLLPLRSLTTLELQYSIYVHALPLLPPTIRSLSIRMWQKTDFGANNDEKKAKGLDRIVFPASLTHLCLSYASGLLEGVSRGDISLPPGLAHLDLQDHLDDRFLQNLPKSLRVIRLASVTWTGLFAEPHTEEFTYENQRKAFSAKLSRHFLLIARDIFSPRMLPPALKRFPVGYYSISQIPLDRLPVGLESLGHGYPLQASQCGAVPRNLTSLQMHISLTYDEYRLLPQTIKELRGGTFVLDTEAYVDDVMAKLAAHKVTTVKIPEDLTHWLFGPPKFDWHGRCYIQPHCVKVKFPVKYFEKLPDAIDTVFFAGETLAVPTADEKCALPSKWPVNLTSISLVNLPSSTIVEVLPETIETLVLKPGDQIGPRLPHLKRLKDVTLSGVSVADFQTWPLPPELTVLRLSNANLDNLGSVVFPPTLTTLGIYGQSKFTKIHIPALPRSLTSLTIRGSPFHASCASQLPTSLNSLIVGRTEMIEVYRPSKAQTPESDATKT